MALLQRFDFRSSGYQRPNQMWICGRAATGEPCRIGPDGRGACQATFECQPRQHGARWDCTRPLSAGGACEAGAMPDGTCCRPIPPCTPVRSLRGTRSLVVRWAVTVTIGFLALLMGANSSALFSPGPLSDGHSALTACADCHSSVTGGPFGWVHSVFADARPVEDSAKCLTCHQAGANALKPHGLPAATLDRMTRETEDRAAATPVSMRLQDAIFPARDVTARAIPCATCHVEHEGLKFDLTSMSDARCQSCHTVRFRAFSSDHPEFTAYPYLRRTRIIFDHNSHIGRHFPAMARKGDANLAGPETCGGCHELGPRRKLMATKPFAATCAGCHGAEISGEARASGPPGVPVLSVPGLDVQSLRRKGAAIGQWPEFSEAEISPFMALLLAADPKIRDALPVAAKLDLLDLSGAGDDEVAAVERLAWAIKRLIFELSAGVPGGLGQRLARATGLAPDHAVIGRLIAALPRDVLLGARRDWLPDLFRELADRAAGKRVAIPAGPAAARAAADLGAPPIPPPEGAQNDILSGGKDDILAGGKDDNLAGGKNDILAGGKEDILSGGKDDILGGNLGTAEKAEIIVLPQTAAVPPEAILEEPEVDAEKFARLGGWYRQDFQILYRPTGHADRFLQAWLTYAGNTLGGTGGGIGAGAGGRWGAAVFATLTDKDAQGQCAKCHSVDRSLNGKAVVNWTPRRPDQETGRMTKFSHSPHFGVSPHFGAVGKAGCLTCHVIDDKAKYLASYAAPGPVPAASNFRPMPRRVCAECHTAEAAGETCVLCHNYHVYRVHMPFLRTGLPGNAAASPNPSAK